MGEILDRVIKHLRGCHPRPEKYFLPEIEWHYLRDELKEYCAAHNRIGPLSADIGYANILVMDILICVSKVINV